MLQSNACDARSAAMSAEKTPMPKSLARRGTSTICRFPGMLHGTTIRSTIPRGRINAIRLEFDAAGFTVVDYRDIPGKNFVALIDEDQPCLAEHEVHHVAEPILLLAHADRER